MEIEEAASWWLEAEGGRLGVETDLEAVEGGQFY